MIRGRQRRTTTDRGRRSMESVLRVYQKLNAPRGTMNDERRLAVGTQAAVAARARARISLSASR